MPAYVLTFLQRHLSVRVDQHLDVSPLIGKKLNSTKSTAAQTHGLEAQKIDAIWAKINHTTFIFT